MKPKETQLGSRNTNKRELERTRIVDHNLEPGLFFFFSSRREAKEWYNWISILRRLVRMERLTAKETRQRKCLLFDFCYLVSKPCLTLLQPHGLWPPGSSVQRISQSEILEWVAISFSRESSWPRDRTRVSCIGRWILYRFTQGSPRGSSGGQLKLGA